MYKDCADARMLGVAILKIVRLVVPRCVRISDIRGQNRNKVQKTRTL